jgi:survival of motor neuron protein-interacting protein 1
VQTLWKTKRKFQYPKPPMASSQPCFVVDTNHKKKRRMDEEDDHNTEKDTDDKEKASSSSPSSQLLTLADLAQMDAQTYLHSVVRQANALPDTFVAPSNSSSSNNQTNNKSHSCKMSTTKQPPPHKTVSSSSLSSSSCAASLQYLLSPLASVTPPPSMDVLPKTNVPTWVHTILTDFITLQTYLQQCDTYWQKTRTFPYTLPTLKERAAWHTFMVGFAEAEGNVGHYFDTTSEDSEKSNESLDSIAIDSNPVEKETMTVPPPVDSWRTHVPSTGYVPTTSLLLQMDQVMVRKLLSHLVHYSTEGWVMTRQRAVWCYALLARLQTPLHREQAVMLYHWCKTLTAQRANYLVQQNNKTRIKQGPNKSTGCCLASLNTIIAILGIQYGQGGGLAATMQVPSPTPTLT